MPKRRTTVRMRELFVEELAQVRGGDPIRDALDKLLPPRHSTEACCEEGPDGCCYGDLIRY